jgi:hypothetical protein
MKKALIAALVGAVIMFLWQFLSHMMLSGTLHKMQGLTPDMESQVIAGLSGAEDGVYMIPAPKPDATWSEHQEMMKQHEGKPWGIINYHKSMAGPDPMQMVWGFILDFIGILIVVTMMGYGRDRLMTFGQRWWFVILAGLFMIVMHLLMDWNWWGYPVDYTMMESLDRLIMWGLTGLWLAWYLGRGMTPAKETTM